jgi:cyclic beta-1,2-glucan synthetase
MRRATGRASARSRPAGRARRWNLTQVVDPSDPVKVYAPALRNAATEPARLRIYAYAEWVLGTNRAQVGADDRARSATRATGALMARNAYTASTTAIASPSWPPTWPSSRFTANRLEFIGMAVPSSGRRPLCRGADLSGTVEAGRDPCSAIAAT